MDVALATQADLLEMVLNRLIDQVPDFFNSQNTWFDDEPIPTQDPGFDLCCSVSPGDGMFDQKEQVGGSPCMLVEKSEIVITPMARYGQDEPDKLDVALVKDKNRGILTQIKPRILSAIYVDHQVASSVTTHKRWEPKDGAGALMTINSLTILRSTKPYRVQGMPYLAIQIHCGVDWRWRL